MLTCDAPSERFTECNGLLKNRRPADARLVQRPSSAAFNHDDSPRTSKPTVGGGEAVRDLLTLFRS
jgi:hypothetical protein